MPDLLADFAVTVTFPVAWGEMDALGHVNNIVYFRYFENGRARYLSQVGFFDVAAGRAAIGPILASINCRFRYALTFPDTVTVGVRVVALGADRFTVLHRVVSQRAQVVAAEGEGVIVSYDYHLGQKTPLSEPVRAAILALDAAAGITLT
ncbi:MAG: thioesterase family protein [Anaerolineae bacterium]|uniref:acyl-CoA thioesterase n=1 Tax=Candidatus Amarolinea dominans TaxID=3140696 RepID=UPI001DD554AF|nr:acyl-CoA thioesterase [Anaerolineae bacterium]MBK9095704.1 acyl-CoA thioesterase [Anaerolineae bacterium]